MLNVIKKLRENKMLIIFMIALIFICSFYGFKTSFANANKNNDTEASEAVPASNEAVEDFDDESPLEAYAYKSEACGETVLVLKYDRLKEEAKT